MEVETAFRRYLLADDTVKGYVGAKVFRHRLEESPEGTGGRAIVLSRQPGWRGSDPVQTVEFPRLWVDCYADPTRLPSGVPSALDAEDKALALARAVVPTLHGLRGVLGFGAYGSNPGLLLVSCAKAGEVRLIHGYDLHGSGQGAESPGLGDMVIARVTFNVACAS